jgi:NO-binding membrane sensor protein with MHYT domain
MQQFKSFSVTTLFSLIVFYVKFFGLTTFVYPSEVFKISFIGTILFIFNLGSGIAQSYFFGLESFNVQVSEVSNSKIFYYAFLISVSCAVGVKIFVSLMNFIFRKKIFYVLKDIENLDNEVRNVMKNNFQATKIF